MATSPIGTVLGGNLSPNASSVPGVGRCVVDTGGNVWLPYNEASAYVGYQIGIVVTPPAAPGTSMQVLVSGTLPPQAFNIGGGNASDVVAGVTPGRGSGGQIIGQCDPAGTISLQTSYLGLTPGGLAVLPSPLAPPASGTWSQAHFYVDPQNSLGTSSDANDAKTTGTAVLTWQRVAALLTTVSPLFGIGAGITVTVTFLSSQTANTDPVILSPFLLNASNFVLLGTLTNVGAAFNPATVTAKVQTATGAPLKATGFPAGTRAGDIATNVTKASRARVDSVTGGGTNVVLTQPLTVASLTTVTSVPNPVEDNTWANTDSIQMSRATSVNVEGLAAAGGDSVAGFSKPVIWLQDVNVPDASGAPGTSGLAIFPVGCGLVLSNVQIDPQLLVNNYLGVFGVLALGCFLNGSVVAIGGYFAGGSINTSLINGPAFENVAGFDCNVILHGNILVKGPYCYGTSAFFDSGITLAHNAAFLVETGASATTVLYGNNAAAILEGPNSTFQNAVGTWATTVLFSTFKLDAATTGIPYNGGSPVALTAANLDLYGGLQNPVTGNKFCDASAPPSANYTGIQQAALIHTQTQSAANPVALAAVAVQVKRTGLFSAHIHWNGASGSNGKTVEMRALLVPYATAATRFTNADGGNVQLGPGEITALNWGGSLNADAAGVSASGLLFDGSAPIHTASGAQTLYIRKQDTLTNLLTNGDLAFDFSGPSVGYGNTGTPIFAVGSFVLLVLELVSTAGGDVLTTANCTMWLNEVG